MEEPVSFGQWIKRRRKALDLTQKELASRVGYSTSALRKIESGERRPSRLIAELIADSLEIQPEDRQVFINVARGLLSPDKMPPVIKGSSEIQSSEKFKIQSISNLPLQLSPILGRDIELAELAQMLQDPNCRLITLFGPGGNGKTRLAVEAAGLNKHLFADGVYFVSLSSLSSPEYITPAMAAGLDFPFFGNTDPKIQLINYLKNKNLLLLLDGIELLLNDLQLIMDLLCQAPQVKLLVTSQERLNLEGEWVFEVHGLDYPGEDRIDSANDYSAVALFLQRAHRVRPDFNPGPEDIKWILRICHLVDGMPLGIELAAAWIRALSPQEIGEEIQRDLDFLSGSARDLPERHHSLRTVFDHSWKQLTREEQGALCQLSVFKGGFQREAADHIAGTSLQMLSALVDKSLLQRTPAGRYDMHELLRRYAWTKLVKRVDLGSKVKNQHCNYYMEFVHRLGENLNGSDQKESLDLINSEIDNIRLAWRWAVQNRKVDLLQKPIKGLWYFFDIRGRFQEAENTLRQAVLVLEENPDLKEHFGEEYDVLIPRLYSYQGWFCMRLGKYDQAQALLEKSIQPLRHADAKTALIDALNNLGVFYRNTGEYKRSQDQLQEALKIAKQIKDEWNITRVNANLGLGSQALGNLQEAFDKIVSALQSYRTMGDKRMIAMELQYLGGLHSELGMYEAAKKELEESLEISQEINDPWEYGMALTQLSILSQMQGAYQDAVRLSRQSLALFRGLGESGSILHSLNQLAQVLLEMEDYSESQQAFGEALATAMEIHNTPEVLETLTGIASWLAKRGEKDQALTLTDLIASHPATSMEILNRVKEIQGQLETKAPRKSPERLNGKTPSFEKVVMDVLEKYMNPVTTPI